MSEPIVAFKFEKKEAVCETISSVRSSDVVHPNVPSHFSEIGDVGRFRRFWEGSCGKIWAWGLGVRTGFGVSGCLAQWV